MGKIDFTNYTVSNTQNSNSQQNPNLVGFFVLKNDGDEAIVRFMHQSPADFEGYTVHNVTIGGKNRKIKCLRDSVKDPIDNCPLCKAGKPIQDRMFVHLLEYVKDEQGNIVALPRVWERPASFNKTLIDSINEYGPLEETIYKIKRNGTGQSTTYSVMYGNPNVYRNDLYPIKEDAFKDYSALRHKLVLDKNYNELVDFCLTGSFPETKKDVDTQPQTPPATPTRTYNTQYSNQNQDYSTGILPKRTPNF